MNCNLIGQCNHTQYAALKLRDGYPVAESIELLRLDANWRFKCPDAPLLAEVRSLQENHEFELCGEGDRRHGATILPPVQPTITSSPHSKPNHRAGSDSYWRSTWALEAAVFGAEQTASIADSSRVQFNTASPEFKMDFLYRLARRDVRSNPLRWRMKEPWPQGDGVAHARGLLRGVRGPRRAITRADGSATDGAAPAV